MLHCAQGQSPLGPAKLFRRYSRLRRLLETNSSSSSACSVSNNVPARANSARFGLRGDEARFNVGACSSVYDQDDGGVS